MRWCSATDMASLGQLVSCTLVICLQLVANAAAKRNYRVEVEAFEIVRDPAFVLQIKQLRLSKYNDTTNIIYGNFTYIEDLPVNTMASATAYQLLTSNKYSKIPVALKPFNFCHMMENDKQFYPAFLVNSNFPTKCPIAKGDFWLKDFIPEFKDMPDELPGERWRVDWLMKSGKRVINKAHVFFYVNRNI